METLIIVIVVGIVAALAIPSLAGMLESVRLTQSVTELRVAFQDSQRYAIRTGKSCETSLVIPGKPEEGAELSGPCIAGSQKLPDGVTIATNLVSHDVSVSTMQNAPPSSISLHAASLGPNLMAQTNGTKTKNGHRDYPPACEKTPDCPFDDSNQRPTVEVEVVYGRYGGADFNIETGVLPPNSPVDPSGKFVAYLPNKPKAKKRCVALSRTLGITRIGVYSGELDSAAITDGGVCTASDWTTQ
jgi:type II secretory pathway pseudopilin PulG